MNASFNNQLETALTQYDKVVFLYRLSQESCTELRMILKKGKQKILLLTDWKTPDFPCDQRRLNENECRYLLELYLSYSFSDRFVLLTDQNNFPWPSVNNFAEAGLLTKGEILEAMLR